MLEHQIRRILRTKLIDKLVVATSIEAEDSAIEDLCKRINIDYFRGSLEDVLDRFYQAASKYKPRHVVRLTGDCPLTDPEIIDRVIQFHIDGGFDYSSNALEPTYPDGLDVEIIRFPVLKRAWIEANLKSNREHVTLYIYNNPACFNIGIQKNQIDLSNLRWTVDDSKDFELISNIYNNLYPRNPNFTTLDILRYLEERADIGKINSETQRNEGLVKSLHEDYVLKN